MDQPHPAQEGSETERGKLQRWGGARLQTAIASVDRTKFVPSGSEGADEGYVRIGPNRVLPSVATVAMMVAGLSLKSTDRVLEIGGGTGYQAAVLSRLVRQVYSVEPDPELAESASHRLAELGCINVLVVEGDVRGRPSSAPYDAIVVWGGINEVPEALVNQLVPEGRLVIPFGDADAQLVLRLQKGVDTLVSDTLGPAELPALPHGSTAPARFPWS
jgi:protein-L-isoaspartate(D-aspartate) O-methyltransferase